MSGPPLTRIAHFSAEKQPFTPYSHPSTTAPEGRSHAMYMIALKMLVGDRLKYLALVAGVAFAALLITQQAAIFMGYTLQIGAWIRDTRVADLWVMDDQVEFDNDFKQMPDTALQ